MVQEVLVVCNKLSKIIDESGVIVSECGEIEEEAWEQFHGE